MSFYEQRKTRSLAITWPNHFLRTSAFVISALPFVWSVGIVWFAIRAREYLGYWPYPAHPDPKSLPETFDFHSDLLILLFFCLGPSLLIMIMFYVVGKAYSKMKLFGLPLKIYLWGWVVILSLFFIPRINFVNWFMD